MTLSVLRVMRESISAANVMTLADVRDQTDNQMARVKAVPAVGALSGCSISRSSFRIPMQYVDLSFGFASVHLVGLFLIVRDHRGRMVNLGTENYLALLQPVILRHFRLSIHQSLGR